VLEAAVVFTGKDLQQAIDIRSATHCAYVVAIPFVLFRGCIQASFTLVCRFLTLIHAYFAEVPMLQSMRAQVRFDAST
jgi:hypothetical protein